MTDDIGFAAPSTFGGVIPTPALDRTATDGGRFGGYGLYLLKGKPVFLWNLLDLKRVRPDLLPAADMAKVHTLLRKYLDQRLLFYSDADAHQLQQINSYTAHLQAELLSAVLPATNNPTRVTGLAVAGMNDVLNSQGYTQAAFWNHIPTGEWGLLGMMPLSLPLGRIWLAEH
jgi:hypothetical protein